MFVTAPVLLADDPPDVAGADDVLPAVANVLDWVLLADPVADEDPVAEPPDAAAVPVVVAELVCVAAAVGKFTAP